MKKGFEHHLTGPEETEPPPRLELTPLEPPPRLADVVRDAIRATIRFTGGNRSRAARLLGIDRRTLYRKMALYEDEDEKQCR